MTSTPEDLPTETRAADPATDFIPLGDSRLDRILALVERLGDEAESSGLEVKSPLDLRSSTAKVKIAKFILGMANRSEQTAARDFQGYGVMVIGSGLGASPGCEHRLEEHQLKDALRKFFGPEAPHWTMSSRAVDATHACVFIIVDPPRVGDPLFVCHSDGQGDEKKDTLRDGAIYIRDSTQTCEAKSWEVDALVRRACTNRPPATNLDVTITGTATRITGSQDALDLLLCWDADRVSKARIKASDTGVRSLFTSPSIRPEPSYVTDKRPTEVVQAERDRAAFERWAGCVSAQAAAFAPRVTITLTNNADGQLESPELRLTLPHTRCLEATDPQDLTEEEAMPWPVERNLLNPRMNPALFSMPHVGDCPTDWTQDVPCTITLTPAWLPPRTPRTPNTSFVLLVDDPDLTTITGTWTLVAKNLPAPLTGSVTIDVAWLRADQVIRAYGFDEQE